MTTPEEREGEAESRRSTLWNALERASCKFGDEERRALERVQNATFRGAAIGLVLRGGYVSFSALTSLLRRKRGQASTKNAESVLRWTAFLGQRPPKIWEARWVDL